MSYVLAFLVTFPSYVMQMCEYDGSDTKLQFLQSPEMLSGKPYSTTSNFNAELIQFVQINLKIIVQKNKIKLMNQPGVMPADLELPIKFSHVYTSMKAVPCFY